MPLTSAPLFDDMVGVPSEGAAFWMKTSDSVRIRVARWLPKGDARGTVLMLPGRTEYIEKYGDTARELGNRGFATLVIDWRGQGLADRLTDDRRLGHVIDFPDYQKDLSAALELATELKLPQPYHMIGHSMGGGIGLRAAMEGLPVQSCVFSGPMWGIGMSPALRPVSWALTTIAPMVGLGLRLPPSTRYESYVEALPFDGNTLTTDPECYKMMQSHLDAHPELGLGGPTLVWLREALSECRELAARPSPDIPCLTFLGAEEQIVDLDAVRKRMKIWPRGTLDVIEGARHEVLMESADIREHAFDRMDDLFSTSALATA